MGSTRDESWRRLRAEGWGGQFKSKLDEMKSHLQSVADGTGDFIYDEYKVEVERMPPGVEPEAFLSYLASDLNHAIRNAAFDKVNVFIRRQQGKPEVGEIVDIDIAGPENGSVIPP